ncbi:MAG TPA: alpha/beta hydrolase [Gaiellaceae bacterium]|nr:alpha/beta hydrolase [Gaiellaceae bacterium]
MAHATATADGLRIAYDDSGGPGLPLLCLTGWCSSRARYDRFLEVAAQHRRVVRLDWRGHGDSDPAGGDFGVEEQTADALAVVEAAGLDAFVPVSASHSGWVAIELRRRLGERVPRIVHMDWLLVEPSERYLDVIRMLQSEDRWPEARDILYGIWRSGVDDPAIEAVLATMSRHGAEMWMRSGRKIEAGFAEHGSPFEALRLLDPPVEVLHLYGQPTDEEYFARQERFAAEHPWFRVRRLPARTHFAMTETPEQAVAEIERFLG